MKPEGTTYRTVKKGEYQKLHALMRDWEMEEVKVKFPVVVADRDGVIVGMLGTNPAYQMTVAGPFYVNPRLANPGMVALRLVEAYDRVMQTAGLREYMFFVRLEDEEWLKQVSRAGMEPISGDGTAFWFRRDLWVVAAA